MKTSAFLAACGAILAAASPILQDRRLYIKTDIVIEWVTVTVTEGETTTAFRRPVTRPKPTTTTSTPQPTTTSVAPPPPPPPPTSSTTKPVVVPTPVPTPQPSPEPSPKPSPEPSTSPAPVIPVPSPVVVVTQSSAAPAPVSSTNPVPAQPSDYPSTAIYHHNIHRFNHSADALEWSAEHAQYAQTLAERCVFAHDTTIGGGGYGQNLAMWGSTGNPEAFGATGSVARAASNGWYNNELNDFPAGDYGKDTPDMSNFEKWGHFSQLVWKGTKKVGCYSNFCKAGTLSSLGSWYTVCNYFPAGNVGGAYGNNVAPPQGQAVVTAA